MRGVLQRIFAQDFASYPRRRRLAIRERRAVHAICTCRTAAQGTHVRICPRGDYIEHFYNSCKHRSCPRCGGWETVKWVQQQEARLLPCPYYHIVFTLPKELNVLWQFNRASFVNHLFQAAWGTLSKLYQNERWVGGLPGALMVFQSWGETLNTHPHLHVLITAGGLNKQGIWKTANQSYLFPTAALTKVFRGKLLDALGHALFKKNTLIQPPGQDREHWLRLFNTLRAKPWHAHIQPPYDHPMGVIRYLAFYIKGGPIAEDRITRLPDHQIRIAYKRPDEHRSQWITLPTQEFFRRFLNHVPPKGSRTVRAYGLFHHRAKAKTDQARNAIPPTAPEARGDLDPQHHEHTRSPSPRPTGFR